MDDKLLSEAKSIKDEIIKNRRALHENAETGFNLENTVRYVKGCLENYGIEAEACGKAGIVAEIGKGEGKTFLLRADMDALPFAEQTKLGFSCKNGNMHACGHDMHTAMLLGAAKLLKAHENELKGRVKLMFQPAEEIFEGSKDMISSGLLENDRPDGAMMIHVMTGIPFKAGTVIISAPGAGAPAADIFRIEVRGKGCHGSMPSVGADPVNAAAHIIIALQEINARELSLSQRAVLTIGYVRGGNAANAIPDSVTLGGSLRAYDEQTRSFIRRRISEISELVAKTFRVEAEVIYESGCPVLINDEHTAECVAKYLKQLLGNNALTAKELGGGLSDSAGSEDFAYVSRQVPSVMVALAAGSPSEGYSYALHNPKVTFDEDALAFGCAAYAYCAMCWLEEHN